MRFQLLLYVAGQSTRSNQAIQNLRQICEDYLAGQYDLTIIDVLRSPEAAEDAHILAVPTLILAEPSPKRRIVGDLTNYRQVLAALDIHDYDGDDGHDR